MKFNKDVIKAFTTPSIKSIIPTNPKPKQQQVSLTEKVDLRQKKEKKQGLKKQPNITRNKKISW